MYRIYNLTPLGGKVSTTNFPAFFICTIMQLLLPTECYNCGLVDEAKFVYAGPHVKQICNGCGKYVKFFDKAKIPDAKETKLRIWAITTDLEQIAQAKVNIGFIENLKGLDLKMIYWRLYLEIRRVSGI